MSETTQKIHTTAQIQLLKELTETHGLDVSQISFEGAETTPIFDHEAVSILSLKLTDIQNIEPTKVEFDGSIVTVHCVVTLPDGRQRGSIGSCEIGETLFGEEFVSNKKYAEAVATSRAFRSGIRNVGINLFRAHQNFIKTGQASTAHTKYDPRQPQYQELHVLAAKIGYIEGSDKAKYEQYIGELFDGRTSAKELDDLELQRLLVSFRAMSRLNTPTAAVAA